MLQTPGVLCSPPLGLLRFVLICLKLEGLKLDTVFKVQLHQCRKRDNTSFDLLARLRGRRFVTLHTIVKLTQRQHSHKIFCSTCFKCWLKLLYRKQFYNSSHIVKLALFCIPVVCASTLLARVEAQMCLCDSLFSGQVAENQNIRNVLCGQTNSSSCPVCSR